MSKLLLRKALLACVAVAICCGPICSSWADAEKGWPNQAGDKVFGSPAVVDIDGDTKMEIVVASLHDGICVWQHDGLMVNGWPKATTHEIRSSISIGDLDGDDELELVACTSDRIIAGTTEQNYVYAFNHDGSLVNGFPKSVTDTRITSTPVIGNIDDTDNPDRPEIVVLAGDTKLYAWHSDGSSVSGFPVLLGGEEDAFGNLVITSSPALADTDDDAVLEILTGSTGDKFYYLYDSGVSYATSARNWILSSPSVGDIDADGDYEAVVGSGDGRVYAWHIWDSTLSLVQGWPQETRGLVYSSPALADIDGDDGGKLEIVCGSYDERVYIWNHDGTLLSGWPQEVRRYVLASPLVADLDGDGEPEIVAASAGNKVYAWNRDGSLLGGFPRTLTTDIYASPAVGDLDGDKRMSIVVATFDGMVYEWELPYDTSQSTFDGAWSMFCRDPNRSAWVPKD